MSHADMPGFTPDDRDTKVQKRHLDVREIHKINNHLTCQWEQHIGKDEMRVAAADIQLHVPPDREADIRNMLQKHERMWLGQLGESNITEMRINLVREAKTFRSPPYRAVSKTRELEQAEIDKQL